MPVASGDFVGNGGQQVLLMTGSATEVTSQLSLVWVEYGDDGVDLVTRALGAVPVRLDVGAGAAARDVVTADVDEDRGPDVWFYPGSTRLSLRSGGAGSWMNDGRGGLMGTTPVAVPGLDVLSPRGPAGQPGGVQAAAAFFGFGTRASATQADSRTELLYRRSVRARPRGRRGCGGSKGDARHGHSCRRGRGRDRWRRCRGR